MNGIIYAYFNKKKYEKDGIKKYYIGQTIKTPEERAGKNGKKYKTNIEDRNYKFIKAIKKWGWDAFELLILETNINTKEKLDELETKYIIEYDSINNGYNTLAGGSGFKFMCKCNKILIGTQRCEICGYSIIDDIKFKCKKCGNKISSPTKRCECGYSSLDDANYICKKCGSKLNNSSKRCTCGWCLVDEIEYKCKNCGNIINSPGSTCDKCGYNIHENIIYKCKNCGSQIKSPLSRCDLCGYLQKSNYKCKNCNAPIKSPSSKCDNCGYIIKKKYTCKKCGNEITGNTAKCSKCGYIPNIKYKCKNCGKSLPTVFSKCDCGYQNNSGFYCKNCKEPLKGKFATCSKCGTTHQPKKYCKKCGNEINSLNSTCKICNICHAGYDNWEEWNPVYRITLFDEILIENKYMDCVVFLMNLLNVSEYKAKQIISSKEYKSAIKNKYNNIKIIKIT